MTAAVAGPSAADVEACLDTVCDPCSIASGTPLGIVEMGLLRGWTFADGVLTATICVTGPGCTYVGLIADHARRALTSLPGVVQADIRLDPAVVWSEPLMTAAARARLSADRARRTARWADRL